MSGVIKPVGLIRNGLELVHGPEGCEYPIRHIPGMAIAYLFHCREILRGFYKSIEIEPYFVRAALDHHAGFSLVDQVLKDGTGFFWHLQAISCTQGTVYPGDR
jgi:hypothetical protein